MKIRSRFSHDSSVKDSLSFEGVQSRTKQSFAQEADVNNIMRRYIQTGVLIDPSTVSARRVAVLS